MFFMPQLEKRVALMSLELALLLALKSFPLIGTVCFKLTPMCSVDHRDIELGSVCGWEGVYPLNQLVFLIMGPKFHIQKVKTCFLIYLIPLIGHGAENISAYFSFRHASLGIPWGTPISPRQVLTPNSVCGIQMQLCNHFI